MLMKAMNLYRMLPKASNNKGELKMVKLKRVKLGVSYATLNQ